jgi:hypothetical protein
MTEEKERPDPVQQEALAIDRYYDSLLYNGMPIAVAVEVEERRRQAHARLVNRALGLDQFRRGF